MTTYVYWKNWQHPFSSQLPFKGSKCISNI
jgi:hypothetical protein